VSRHPLPQSLASDYVGPALRYASCMCYLFSSIHELRLERERELKTLVSVIPGGIAGMIRIFPGHL
jgi:hypothetical protein